MAHTVFTKYAAALFDLKIAMAIRDRNQLRQALGVVQNYELETPMVEEAMKTLKEIDVMMKAQQNMAAEAAASVAGFDAEESTRKAREETAREARFDLKNYEFLRLPEDYSKGMFNNKVKVCIYILYLYPYITISLISKY